eukprot:8288962-Pyramimonas_sp.AAC.1
MIRRLGKGFAKDLRGQSGFRGRLLGHERAAGLQGASARHRVGHTEAFQEDAGGQRHARQGQVLVEGPPHSWLTYVQN